ncbi:MAG: uroporphyrinogen decarboxylase family protein [Finegoldia sp.]|nr:uroporphyrinogen decarboxylase family protein [Finegoldia sp.]
MDKEELHDEVVNYKPQMTNKERMEKYLTGQRVDHLPFSLGLDVAYGHILGYTSSQLRGDFDASCEVIQKRIDTYHVDGINISLGLKFIGAACGSVLSFPDDGPEFVSEFVMADGEIDMSKIDLPHPRTNPVLSGILEKGKKLKERFSDQTISTSLSGPITTAASIRPVEKLLRDMRKNQAGFKDLMQFSLDAALKWVQVFEEEFGPHATVGIAAPVSANDLLSPKQFDELSLPYLRDLVEGIIKITGKKPSLHMCGHTKAFWSKIHDLNIASFSVDNLENLRETKEALGDRMMILGNVPPVEVLLQGSPEDVIESVKDCIIKAADSPSGYIVSAGCGLSPLTPEENLDAFIYAIRKYGADAKLGEIPQAVYQD